LDTSDRVSPNSSRSLDQVVSQLKEFQTRQRDVFVNFQDTQKELARALEYQSYETEKNRHAEFLKENTRLKKDLDETNGKILGFQGLNALCKKADIAATDSSIAEINFNAALYTRDLFADPIQIALSRIRTTLKGDRRDGMTTNVVYKGSVYSNLDQLSGGERQRCNLAFILSVNNIVGSPFLLLDECLNNLDGETHAEILVFLRQACHGKLILVVAHEAATAKFDKVVVV
jgi:DNA repair exonuclease SbcCD ATPase subunit